MLRHCIQLEECAYVCMSVCQVNLSHISFLQPQVSFSKTFYFLHLLCGVVGVGFEAQGSVKRHSKECVGLNWRGSTRMVRCGQYLASWESLESTVTSDFSKSHHSSTL